MVPKKKLPPPLVSGVSAQVDCLVVAATAVADEAVHGLEYVPVVAVRDEHLLALLDVPDGREGHHLLALVPVVLCVPPAPARVVEVGRDCEHGVGAHRQIEPGAG